MSVCRARSLSLFGIEALPVEVEVDVSSGLPGFSIVGLPDAAVQEARERVRVAISNSGYKFPTKKVIVNLAPANLRKEGPAFDLPIALGILAASGALPAGGLEDAGVVGELSLDGGLRGVRGALSMAEGARREGLGRLLVPERDAPEAAAISGVEVYGMRSLREAGEFLGDCRRVSPAEPAGEDRRQEAEDGEDFADVAGQRYAKRALEAAAAGAHNLVVCVRNHTRSRAGFPYLANRGRHPRVRIGGSLEKGGAARALHSDGAARATTYGEVIRTAVRRCSTKNRAAV